MPGPNYKETDNEIPAPKLVENADELRIRPPLPNRVSVRRPNNQPEIDTGLFIMNVGFDG